jgi:ferritin-like metal-binding protein YciE
MGYDRDAELLQQTLDEESMANEKLTQIAESHVNMQAR